MPSVHSPIDTVQLTSCVLPYEEGGGGDLTSSSKQLDFKLQTLIPSPFCFSPSSFHSCIFLHHLPPPFWASPKQSNINTWSALCFHGAIECPSQGSRGMGYNDNLARSQSLLPLNETLNLLFGFSVLFSSLNLRLSTPLVFVSMSHNYPAISQIIPIFPGLIASIYDISLSLCWEQAKLQDWSFNINKNKHSCPLVAWLEFSV